MCLPKPSAPERLRSIAQHLLSSPRERRGADVKAIKANGETALHLAVAKALIFSSLEPVVEILINAGADVSAAIFTTGETPLHLAAAKGGETLTRLLLDSGADDSVRNSDGKTPLHLAEANRNVKKALIRQAIDLDEDETELYEVYTARLEAVALLLQMARAEPLRQELKA
ncbi:Serine/threonine-protein kinase TNNI3K [Tolypocladium ophioglossoides CBS 100239]|uniref:Serine/threonine-protein kinase TNNI3K n=1 Tax=Tolypocladium ophioglossoides (strain CBS 100239) TaxID=1163406 RepID=A0A0L0NI16_TOLOC|nr:Serine/threonine-protein kinase TNNI3K [Tolypocladium ophioglossoides CBS 100239]